MYCFNIIVRYAVECSISRMCARPPKLAGKGVDRSQKTIYLAAKRVKHHCTSTLGLTITMKKVHENFKEDSILGFHVHLINALYRKQ